MTLIDNSLHQVYILHYRPFRDTSILAELLAPDLGRISIIAKGVRGGKSRVKALLQPFVPLWVSLFGKGELLSLRSVETSGMPFMLQGIALFSGLYLNELLIRLLHRHDPHPHLFQRYVDALKVLSTGNVIELQIQLRLFEKFLLQELGYALNLNYEAYTVKPILHNKMYYFDINQGLIPTSLTRGKQVFLGDSVLALQRENLTDFNHLRDAKRLIQLALAPLLNLRPLKSAELLDRML